MHPFLEATSVGYSLSGAMAPPGGHFQNRRKFSLSSKVALALRVSGATG